MQNGKGGFLVVGIILLIVGLSLCCVGTIVMEHDLATPTPVHLLPKTV